MNKKKIDAAINNVLDEIKKEEAIKFGKKRITKHIRLLNSLHIRIQEKAKNDRKTLSKTIEEICDSYFASKNGKN